MAKFTSASAYAAWMRAHGRKAHLRVQSQFRQEVELMYQEAIKLTSGTVTTKQLRQMGHPFARRRQIEARITWNETKDHGVTKSGKPRRFAYRTQIPKLPINRQTGRLQKSLRIMPRHSGNAITYHLWFTAPYAKFVLAPGGTWSMLPRGFWSRMRQLYRRPALERMRRVWRDALGT